MKIKLPMFFVAVLGLVAVSFSQTSPPASTTLPDSQPSTRIEFLSVVGAGRGQNASVTVDVGAPGVICSIVCVTPSGKISTAKGLGDEAADANGKVTWTWLIGPKAKVGTGTIVVTCGGDQASTTIPFKP